MSKCKNCFFSEISLRKGASIYSSNARLWCWFHERHEKKSYTCDAWTDPETEGNARAIADNFRMSKILKEYMRRKKEARRIAS